MPQKPVQSAETVQWLARNAAPLASVVPGGSADDLAPLGRALEGVRVVGLGEATHGTREFFLLKHRIVEYLVSELDFTVFAMEASESAAPAVDAYIRKGQGSPTNALSDLGFWTWRTHEVLDLLTWMHDHNTAQRPNHQLKFIGIDPQKCAASVAVLEAFLPHHDFRDLLTTMKTADPGSHPREEHLPRQAQALRAHLATLDTADASEARHHAEILVRAADLVTRPHAHEDPELTLFAARDRYMADAVSAVLDKDPEARVILWAHNGHIATSLLGGAAPSLGHHLRTRHGDAYYALGLHFGQGSFRARRAWPGPWQHRIRPGRARSNRVGPPPPLALEGHLAAAHPGDHYINLRAAASAPAEVRAWLEHPQYERTFGAVVPRFTHHLNFGTTTPSNDYDGIAYVAETTSSRSL